MAAQVWPAYARLSRDAYSEEHVPAVEIERFEDGFLRQTATRSKMPVRIGVSALIEAGDRAAFQIWLKTTLNHGSKSFDFTPPGEAAAITAQIAGGRVRWRLAFREPPTWSATMTLEALR